MRVPNKFCWLVYIFVNSAILLPVLILGLRSPDDLETMLTTGGLIESLPAIVHITTAMLSLLVVLKLAIAARKFLFWGLYSVFCFVLAGEEASWGRESVLGWQMRQPSSLERSGDLHNLVSDALVASIPTEVFYGVFTLIILAVILTLLKFKGSNRAIFRGLLNYLINKPLSAQFIVVGLILMLFGLVDSIQEFLNIPYLRGQWSVEESFELLGSIALLFAVLVKAFVPEEIPDRGVASVELGSQ